eukprot:m.3841 g.3841  ORF g.3841 m.3841 type:complete len:63 (-) comp3748_c0_seq1:132-320(-)
MGLASIVCCLTKRNCFVCFMCLYMFYFNAVIQRVLTTWLVLGCGFDGVNIVFPFRLITNFNN